MYEACERNGLTYTFGFSTNPRLKRLTEGLMARAVEQYAQAGQKQRLFECFAYQCDGWPHPRGGRQRSGNGRLPREAECHDGGTNLRFVVTNRPGVATPADGEREYDDYVRRGESEQRMDELKGAGIGDCPATNGLRMDRLSCHRFMANFFRLLLHAAAFNLLNGARDHADVPRELRAGRPCTWRTRLIKVAAEVVQTTRRVVVHLAAQWPWWPEYRAVSRRALAFPSSA